MLRTDDPSDGLSTDFLSLLLAHEYNSRSSIVDVASICSSDSTTSISYKDRVQALDFVVLDVFVLFIFRDGDGSFAVWYGDGSYFGLECSVRPGFGCFLIRVDGKLVLVLSSDGVVLCGLLGAVAHSEMVKSAWRSGG